MLHFSTSNMKKILLVTAYFLIGGCVTVSALTITPARMEISTDPGTPVSDSFLLINEQDTDQVYYTSVENFEAQGESGTPNFTASKEGLASWVDVPAKITLKKGERVKIPFTVNVPENADVGGHFAAIFLSTVPPTTNAGEVAVGAKIGMLVLLKVNGDVKEGGGILSFITKKESWFLVDKPITFVYRFNNSGNDRVNPIGTITIRNMIGMKSAVLNANPTVGNILPNSTRKFEVAWGAEPAIESAASFFDHVQYEWRNFAFGYYSATISLAFGNAGTSSSKVSFFMFPWHVLAVITVTLIALYFILRNLIRRYNRWIIQQAQLPRK
jgi:hypothetical protein